MGGNLAWTLRLSDGTEYRMDRWTNSMPSLIVNPDFLDEKPQAIEEALESWLKMRDDWTRNKGKGPFELPMTPVYAPYPFGMKPSEYGLVVTDFQTKTFLSLQGYTSFESFFPVRAIYGNGKNQFFGDKQERMDLFGSLGRLGKGYLMVRTAQDTEPFAERGYKVELEEGPFPVYRVTIPKGEDWKQVEALCDTVRMLSEMREKKSFIHDNPITHGDVAVDLSPFTFQSFPETLEGYQALYARIQELGFDLSESEHQAWAQRFARLEEDE